MSKDVIQFLGAVFTSLVFWSLGFWANSQGERVGKTIVLPIPLAKMFGSSNGTVSGGVLIIQVWALICVAIAIVLNLLSVEFDTKSAVLLVANFGGGMMSVVAARIYARYTQ